METDARCRACRAPLPAGARFCPECGERQASPLETARLTNDGDDTVRSEPKPPSGDPEARPGEKKDRTTAPERPGAPPRRAATRTPEALRLLSRGDKIAGTYTVASLLGEGAMGVVYRCDDDVLKRSVAIKMLHGNLAGDPELRRRFVREGRVMHTFTHPNVATVYDFIEEDRVLAIVMELVDGPSLSKHIEKWRGRMPYDEVRAIFSRVLDAMSEAHGQGIVHRDLKPDNILLRTANHRLDPKIVDFGIAKILEGTTFTITGTILGTCRYMAPEQVQTPHAIDRRADIYSLGITLYQMCTGRCPFEHGSHYALLMAHAKEAPPPPSQHRSDIPDGLERLIMDTLSKSPDARPQTCAEFKTRLDAALENTAPMRVEPVPDLPMKIEDSDGGQLILIPPGVFMMGPDKRSVHLDAFYIDRNPVTNRQFEGFLRATDYRPPADESGFLMHWPNRQVPPGLEDHPVVHVSWNDARAYAIWCGKRLPTEAEWEKAARGTDGRKYPWGKADPEEVIAHPNRRKTGTLAVRSSPESASPYGVEDMAGNVWQWVEDIDDPAFYLDGPSHNPRNLVRRGSDKHVVRGGSWMYDARSLRTYARMSFEPHYCMDGVGFRCAMTAR